jgi:hypothetical protein
VTRKTKKPVLEIKQGDWVLLGSTRASYPGEWYVGGVLWVGHGDILVRRFATTGGEYNQLEPFEAVRAVGTHQDLVEVKKIAADGVRELRKAVSDAESALGRARDALFARLNELAAAEPRIIPPDFSAIKERHRCEREIHERFEEERCAADAAGVV